MSPKILYGARVEPPEVEGWTFKGYYTATSGGNQIIDAVGGCSTMDIGGNTTLYAQWKQIDAKIAEGTLAKGSEAYALVASVTKAPERQDTYCTWTYRKTGTTEWIAFNPSGATRDLLATGDSVEVSVVTLPDGSASGEYEFQCSFVTTRWGTGETLTNAAANTVTNNYVRRDVPIYDEETKTLWANGSALKILRDTRDTSRVVVYWDQTWDGVYEGAFKRGLPLSGVDWWVNGGFKNGDENGGGVKIDFVSGEVYGINAGDSLSEAAKGNLHITVGADAKIGNGGTKNWWCE